jgi:hypothetical protein
MCLADLAVIVWMQYNLGRGFSAPTGFEIQSLYLIQVHTAILKMERL